MSAVPVLWFVIRWDEGLRAELLSGPFDDEASATDAARIEAAKDWPGRVAVCSTTPRVILQSLDREVERMEREGWYGRARQERALRNRVSGEPWADWDQWNPAPKTETPKE